MRVIVGVEECKLVFARFLDEITRAKVHNGHGNACKFPNRTSLMKKTNDSETHVNNNNTSPG